MWSGNFVDNTITDFKEIFNLLVTIESGLKFSRFFILFLFLIGFRVDLLLFIVFLWNFILFLLYFLYG